MGRGKCGASNCNKWGLCRGVVILCRGVATKLSPNYWDFLLKMSMSTPLELNLTCTPFWRRLGSALGPVRLRRVTVFWPTNHTHPGQMSLVIPSLVGIVSMSENWAVNGHTTRCTIAPYPWCCGISWCLAEGYRNGDQRRPTGPRGSGWTFLFLDVSPCDRTESYSEHKHFVPYWTSNFKMAVYQSSGEHREVYM